MTEDTSGTGSLRGKVAVITGAARGIGRATAVAFAQEGADVIGIDICAAVDPRSGVTPSTREDLEETGKLIRAAGRRWLGMEADTHDLPALREAALKAKQEFGGVEHPIRQCGHPKLSSAARDGGCRLEYYDRHQRDRDRQEERYAQAIQDAGGTPTGVLAADEETARVALARHSPLGVPWIDPVDVAPVVVFLASDAAAMISGATYAATAGDSANITS